MNPPLHHRDPATLEQTPPGTLRRIIQSTVSGLDWLFGFVSLMGGLAFLSVIPGLNLLSLGYLLHVGSSVAATGRIRDGFVGIRQASVLGSFVAGTWLVLWPAKIVSEMWKDAELIAPGGTLSRNWHLGMIALSTLTFVHILWSCWRGGRIHHFLWPAPVRFCRWLGAPKQLKESCQGALFYLRSLRIPYLFWLGVRGFCGAALWLIPPVGILLAATKLPPIGTALFSILGGLLLFVVVIHLPFLQLHFARTLQFHAFFEHRTVRTLFERAPVAFWLALLSSLLFALPLYLLKIELIPRELTWLPSLVFVAFIFPARLITGWAISRALRRDEPKKKLARRLSSIAIVPVAGIYVLFVYLTQYLSWNGALSLLEQHAFLVPAPLMAL